MTRNSPTSPVLRSHQQFSWEKIISGNPERQLKKQPTINRKYNATNLAKSETLMFVQQRQSNRMKQKFLATLPEVQEPIKPRQQVADTSLSNPTPVMLEIMSRMRQKASTPANSTGKKTKSER